MKKLLTLQMILLVLCLTVKSQPATQWQKLLGGANEDDLYGYSSKSTSDGGSISAGRSFSGGTGTLTGVTTYGQYDGWVLKLNSSGSTTWQKLYGGSDQDELMCIRQTSDGGYITAGDAVSSNTGTLTGITGHGGKDGWIMKLNSSGAIVWQELLGGSADDVIISARQTSDGGYIVSGFSYSSGTGTLTGINSNGDRDGWILKLDASGTTVWQRLVGEVSDDILFESSQTSDGGYIAAGDYSSLQSNLIFYHYNGWLLKLDASGNTSWSQTYGGDYNDQLAYVEQTSDGGYVTAYAESSTKTGNDYEGWVVKTDASGGMQWQAFMGGQGQDIFLGMTLTSDGGYLLSGWSNTDPNNNGGTLAGLTNHGSYDGWLVKLDVSGNTQWQELLGGSGSDLLFGVDQSTDGGYVARGTSGSIDGTLQGVTSYGVPDAWVMKLKALKVAVTSQTAQPTCSTNSITFKITGGTSPYSVQLYRFGVAYGSPSFTNKNVTFSSLPSGSYYATASGAGQDGASSTVTLVPTLTNTSTTNITATKATLNWFVASCANYNSVEYRVHGTTTWTKKKTNGNPDFYTLKNLTPSTTYDWKVAAVVTLNNITATGAYTDSLVFTTNPQRESVNSNSNTINATVYPNPASTQLHIQLNNGDGDVDLVLKDVNDKIVWRALNASSESLSLMDIDVSNFPGGIYLLQVSDSNGMIVTKKIVIAK